MMPDWGDGEAPELGTQRNLYYDKVMAEDTKNMEPVQASLRSPSCRRHPYQLPRAAHLPP